MCRHNLEATLTTATEKPLQIAPMEMEMALPAVRLSVPPMGAPTKGGDHSGGYTKRTDGSSIAMDSGTGVSTWVKPFAPYKVQYVLTYCMKFLPNEYQDFCTSIEKSAYAKPEFSFVKKRGWLTVSRKQQTFRFHRKKEQILNNQLQWEERLSYRCEGEGVKSEGLQWQQVLAAFEQWLGTLQ